MKLDTAEVARSTEPAKKEKSPRSILRVPSLATASLDGGRSAANSTTASRTSSRDYSDRSPTGSPSQQQHHQHLYGSSAAAWAEHGRQPIFVNYRPEEMNMRRQGSWQSGGGGGGAMMMIPASQSSMPPYSPIRIRSSRGGRSSNFFVSNRGRRRVSMTGQRRLPMAARPSEGEENLAMPQEKTPKESSPAVSTTEASAKAGTPPAEKTNAV